MRSLVSFYSPRSLTTELLNQMDWARDCDFFFNGNSERTGDRIDEQIGLRAQSPDDEDSNFDPPTEIVEGEDHYRMNFDLPGMKKAEIKIETHQNTLSVSGERRREILTDKQRVVQSFERGYGSFKRSFTLPAGVQSDNIEAHFNSGVLSLYVPKAAATQKKQVEIKVDKPSIFSNLLDKDPGAVQSVQS